MIQYLRMAKVARSSDDDLGLESKKHRAMRVSEETYTQKEKKNERKENEN